MERVSNGNGIQGDQRTVDAAGIRGYVPFFQSPVLHNWWRSVRATPIEVNPWAIIFTGLAMLTTEVQAMDSSAPTPAPSSSDPDLRGLHAFWVCLCPLFGGLYYWYRRCTKEESKTESARTAFTFHINKCLSDNTINRTTSGEGADNRAVDQRTLTGATLHDSQVSTHDAAVGDHNRGPVVAASAVRDVYNAPVYYHHHRRRSSGGKTRQGGQRRHTPAATAAPVEAPAVSEPPLNARPQPTPQRVPLPQTPGSSAASEGGRPQNSTHGDVRIVESSALPRCVELPADSGAASSESGAAKAGATAQPADNTGRNEEKHGLPTRKRRRRRRRPAEVPVPAEPLTVIVSTQTDRNLPHNTGLQPIPPIELEAPGSATSTRGEEPRDSSQDDHVSARMPEDSASQHSIEPPADNFTASSEAGPARADTTTQPPVSTELDDEENGRRSIDRESRKTNSSPSIDDNEQPSIPAGSPSPLISPVPLGSGQPDDEGAGDIKLPVDNGAPSGEAGPASADTTTRTPENNKLDGKENGRRSTDRNSRKADSSPSLDDKEQPTTPAGSPSPLISPVPLGSDQPDNGGAGDIKPPVDNGAVSGEAGPASTDTTTRAPENNELDGAKQPVPPADQSLPPATQAPVRHGTRDTLGWNKAPTRRLAGQSARRTTTATSSGLRNRKAKKTLAQLAEEAQEKAPENIIMFDRVLHYTAQPYDALIRKDKRVALISKGTKPQWINRGGKFYKIMAHRHPVHTTIRDVVGRVEHAAEPDKNKTKWTT